MVACRREGADALQLIGERAAYKSISQAVKKPSIRGVVYGRSMQNAVEEMGRIDPIYSRN